LHESTQAAVVLLEADDRVAFASTAARELLDRYLCSNGLRLPDTVMFWLRERRRGTTGEPLSIDAGRRALVLELVDGALLLEERESMPRLTSREREIVDLVAEGRTNAEIAKRLWVSTATVRKHLENVYAKLGVHSRTAAVAFVRNSGVFKTVENERTWVAPRASELEREGAIRNRQRLRPEDDEPLVA